MLCNTEDPKQGVTRVSSSFTSHLNAVAYASECSVVFGVHPAMRNLDRPDQSMIEEYNDPFPPRIG